MGKLDVAADRLARLIDTEADERDLEAIAEKAQRVQDDTLLPIRSSEDIVHLLNVQNLHTDGLHDPQRSLFHLGDVGTWPLRCAE